ncbi:MAG TPA: ATP-binding protein, partial [Chitinophagaceae bacterium]|nr:ATP-binding protein [Chitinophagaceae bacterium]
MLQVVGKAEKFTRAISILRELVHQRLNFFENSSNAAFPDDWDPDVEDDAIYQFINRQHPLTPQEYVIILLALVPHLHSSFFEPIIFEHFPNGGDFPEIGGVKGSNHRGMLPTGETAQFLLAGNDIEQRLKVQMLFRTDHWLVSKNVLYLEQVKEGEPVMSG